MSGTAQYGEIFGQLKGLGQSRWTVKQQKKPHKRMWALTAPFSPPQKVINLVIKLWMFNLKENIADRIFKFLTFSVSLQTFCFNTSIDYWVYIFDT